jgi:simple sugar transport system ATP-binding protein
MDSLCVGAGEIVGIAGVEGNGQTELAALIAGTLHRRGSEGENIALDGRALTDLSAAERSAAGLAYIPADRHHEGLVLDFSLSENLHLRDPICWKLAGLRLLDHRAMSQRSGELLREYGAVPPNPELAARNLSGGNQQKVVIARELSRKPRLILACNPTRGLDVGAAADVHARILSAAREAKAGVLLISSDLDEVLLLADRVSVLYRGELREVGLRGVGKEAAGRAMVGAA